MCVFYVLCVRSVVLCAILIYQTQFLYTGAVCCVLCFCAYYEKDYRRCILWLLVPIRLGWCILHTVGLGGVGAVVHAVVPAAEGGLRSFFSGCLRHASEGGAPLSISFTCAAGSPSPQAENLLHSVHLWVKMQAKK